MNAPGLMAVGAGAVLGAWLRWGLTVMLNGVIPNLPLGTLTVNLAGGLIIGVAVEFLTLHPVLPPEIRLFVITGFLGSLTTFSAFSAEAAGSIQRGQYAWTFALIAAHLLGSLAMTFLGIASVRYFAN